MGDDKIRVSVIAVIEIDRGEFAENSGPRRPVPRFTVEDLAVRRVRAAIGEVPGAIGVTVTTIPSSPGEDGGIAGRSTLNLRELKWLEPTPGAETSPGSVG